VVVGVFGVEERNTRKTDSEDKLVTQHSTHEWFSHSLWHRHTQKLSEKSNKKRECVFVRVAFGLVFEGLLFGCEKELLLLNTTQHALAHTKTAHENKQKRVIFCVDFSEEKQKHSKSG
jgi:hypothetical protein